MVSERLTDRLKARILGRRPEHSTTLGDVRALVRQYLPELEEPEGYQESVERLSLPGLAAPRGGRQALTEGDVSAAAASDSPMTMRDRARALAMQPRGGPDWSSTPGPRLSPVSLGSNRTATGEAAAAAESLANGEIPEGMEGVERERRGIGRWALETGLGLVEPIMLAQDAAMLATHTVAEHWRDRSVLINGRRYTEDRASDIFDSIESGAEAYSTARITNPDTGEVLTVQQARDYLEVQGNLVGALWDNFFSSDRKIEWGNYAPLGEVPDRPVDGAQLLEITGLDGGNEEVRRWGGLALDLVYDPLLLGSAVRGTARAVSVLAGAQAGRTARAGQRVADGLNAAIRGDDFVEAASRAARPGEAARAASEAAGGGVRGAARGARAAVDAATEPLRSRFLENRAALQAVNPRLVEATDRMVSLGNTIDRAMSLGPVARSVWTRADGLTGGRASEWFEARWAAMLIAARNPGESIMGMNTTFSDYARTALNWSLPPRARGSVFIGPGIDEAASGIGPLQQVPLPRGQGVPGGVIADTFGESLPEVRRMTQQSAGRVAAEGAEEMMGVLHDSLNWVPESWLKRMSSAFRGAPRLFRSIDDTPEQVQAAMLGGAFDVLNHAGNPVLARSVNLAGDVAEGAVRMPGYSATGAPSRVPDRVDDTRRVFDSDVERLRARVAEPNPFAPADEAGRPIFDASVFDTEYQKALDHVLSVARTAGVDDAARLVDIENRFQRLTEGFARIDSRLALEFSGYNWVRDSFAQGAMTRLGLTAEEAGDLWVEVMRGKIANPTTQVADMLITGRSPAALAEQVSPGRIAPRRGRSNRRATRPATPLRQRPAAAAAEAATGPLSERAAPGFSRAGGPPEVDPRTIPPPVTSPAGAVRPVPVDPNAPIVPVPGSANQRRAQTAAADTADALQGMAEGTVHGLPPRIPGADVPPGGIRPTDAVPRPPAPPGPPLTLPAPTRPVAPTYGRSTRFAARRVEPGPVTPVAMDSIPGRGGPGTQLIPVAEEGTALRSTELSIQMPPERAAELAEGVRVGDLLDGLEVFNRLSIDSFIMSLPEGHIRRAYSVWTDQGAFDRYYQSLAKGKLIPNNVLSDEVLQSAFKDDDVALEGFRQLLAAMDSPLRRDNQRARVADRARGMASGDAAAREAAAEAAEGAFSGSRFTVRQEQGIRHMAEHFMKNNERLTRAQAGQMAQDAWNRVFRTLSPSQGRVNEQFQANLDQLKGWIDRHGDTLRDRGWRGAPAAGGAAPGEVQARSAGVRGVFDAQIDDLDIVMESILGAVNNPLVSGIESVEAARRVLPMQDYMRGIYESAVEGGFVKKFPGVQDAFTNPAGIRYVRIPESQRSVYGGFASTADESAFIHPFLKKEMDDVLRGRSWTNATYGRLRSMLSGGYLASPHIGLTNLMGNIYAATVGGGGLSISALATNMAQLLPELVRGDSPWFRRLQELIPIDDVNAAATNVLRREAGRFRLNVAGGEGSALNQVANTYEAILRKPANIGLLGLDGFQFMDQWVRTAAFKGHVERLAAAPGRAAVGAVGSSGDVSRMGDVLSEAADLARLSALDYGELPRAVEVARDWGVWMFPGFPLLIGGRNISAALDTPGAYVMWDRVGEAVAHAVTDPEERASVQLGMQPWLQSEYGVPVNAWTEDDGSYHANVIPFNQLIPTRNVFGAPMFESLVSAGAYGPMVDMIRAYATQSGEGPLSVEFGRRVFSPESTPLQRVGEAGQFAYNSFAPAFARRLFSFGYRERGDAGLIPAAGRELGIGVSPELIESYNGFVNFQNGRRQRGLGGELLATVLRSPQTVTTSGPLTSALRMYNQAAQQHREKMTGHRERAMYLEARGDVEAARNELAKIETANLEFYAEWGEAMEVIQESQRRAYERRETLEQAP